MYFCNQFQAIKEKCDILRAVGAEVIVCPTDVKPTDPRSYYSVSKRLAKETENGWYVNQYDNLSTERLTMSLPLRKSGNRQKEN
jgi:cystathionine beta-synthase